MRDPLSHSRLAKPATRDAAAEYVRSMTEALPTNVNLYGLLMAAASIMNGLCKDYSFDPEATFSQIVDYLESNQEPVDETPHLFN